MIPEPLGYIVGFFAIIGVLATLDRIWFWYLSLAECKSPKAINGKHYVPGKHELFRERVRGNYALTEGCCKHCGKLIKQ